ncbi:MAG: sigma-70 family RNA polymerase sigma factor [Planctomycetota bacterium]|nr:sigma-70 family RNA polymerase sigma factor [Planctomycetota bacterium]
MADEDTELMLRVAAGEDAAFEPLVRRMLPRLVGYFRRLGADASIAEDCAQEVFLKVFRARAGYTARAKFTTYLFHIARNHWIDVYRHRKAGPGMVSAEVLRGDGDGDGPRREFEGPSPQPDQAGSHRELVAALRRAVATLGQEQHEVFVLARVENLRYQEIGEILGIPVGTVKSRMHAAWRQIRAVLRQEGIEPP